MKALIASVILLVLGSAAAGAAPQVQARREMNPPSRYWLSQDLNRLVFWQVRASTQATAVPAEAASH